MKRILNLLLVLSFIINIDVYAYDFYINKYNVEIVVNENNSFDITETIDVDFIRPSHGIYRNIPIIVDTNIYGIKTHEKVKIKKIKVNEKVHKSFDGNNLVLKIGDKNKTIKGSKSYEIKYNYRLGKDKLKDKDIFYFNIIGDKWDTYIKNVTFKIIMPKKFNENNINFYQGMNGSVLDKNIVYQVNDLTINGKVSKIMDPNNALTILIDLDENYFNKAKNFYITDYALLIIIAISSLTSVIIIGKKTSIDFRQEVINSIITENNNTSKEENINQEESLWLSKEKFDEVINDEEVLIVFFDGIIGPYQMLMPVLESLKNEKKIFIVNTKIEKDLTLEYHITLTPCLIYFINGKEKGRTTGFLSREEIFEFLNK